ncbi:MAG TPA: Sua5/YciO/YrdC/YwlC family protein [Tepidisphaeraceae bacterium]|nr:Sua5/YciO/YrdC/YwlC family protein [Tepidisphaeraceae bacterium]
MPTPIVHIFDTPDYDADIRRAVSVVGGGGLVVLPTETVYGAAGLLNHPQGKAKLQALRDGGAPAKPFTIHLAHRDAAAQYIAPANDFAKRLMRKLWPGPVGLMFDVPAERRAQVAAALNVPESDLYSDGRITLRCPDHMVTTDILAEVNGPVALTMAGAAAGGSNIRFDAMAQELDGKVDLIFDAGPTAYAKPSTLLKVNEKNYEIVRAGVYDERIIERLLKTTILFICSGNTCRSPMSEAIARNVIAKKLNVPEADLERKGINVISAGSFAMPGARATQQGVEALREMGIDLTRHRSRPLSVELIHQADWIYGMGRSHVQAVRSLVPSAADKAQTLNPDGDIEDPIGSDVAVYRDLAGQLRSLIEKRLDGITLA